MTPHNGGGIRSRWVACPECGSERSIRWNAGIRRFRARMYRCDECDFVGPRSQWADPPEWHLSDTDDD